MGLRAHVRLMHVFVLPLLAGLMLILASSIPSSAQNIQWASQFGTDLEDQVNAVATTPGSVYVAGETTGQFPGQNAVIDKDAFVARYDNLGNRIWVRQIGSAPVPQVFNQDVTAGVAADASGVYVAGWTAGTLPQQSSSGGLDAFVRKYDVNGTELWTRQFGTTATDQALAIAVNSTGVYVVGVIECCGAALPGFPTTGGTDAFIRKYDANGNELWTRQFGTLNIERAHGVALDATGIYVTGTTSGDLVEGTNGGRDGFLRKYDVSGNVVWTRQFGSTLPNDTSATDDATGVAVGPSGVYVSGGVAFGGAFSGQTSSGGQWEAYVMKFDTNGTQQWVRQFGTKDATTYAYGVAESNGFAYVVGENCCVPLAGATGLDGTDGWLRIYDANGNVIATRMIGAETVSNDFAYGTAADLTGVYIGGKVGHNAAFLDQTSAGQTDNYVLKVLPAPIATDSSLVSTATFVPAPAPVAPGSIATVFGVFVNDGSLVGGSSFDNNSRLVTRLGGASVTLNGIQAPMLFSFPGQIAIQVPFELAGQSTATLLVTVAGQTSQPATVHLDSVVPGIFTYTQDGKGGAVVIHQDGITPATPQNPAHPGEVVIIYATGLGAVDPPLPTGAPSTGNRVVAATTVTVDGNPATVDFSGAAPGYVGLYQINFHVPANTRSAPDLPLVLNVGGKNANAVTIAVGP